MKKRISKSLLEQLGALDDHLYLLRQNLLGLQKDEAHFKVIAAELRVLVCPSIRTEGLLWRMVERMDVSDAVELQLAGNVDVKHPFANGLTFAFVPIQRAGFGHPNLPHRQYSLRKVIKHCDAIFITGKGLTHEYLIKAIAQQMGSAHEDDDIELPLATLKAMFINGTQPYIPILTLVSELVLEVGERILSKAEGSHGFKRKTRLNTFKGRSRSRFVSRGRYEMNRTQLIVMWVGIGILVLMGLFPPGKRGGYDFILEARNVSLSRLCIEWAIVIMLSGGFIYNLKVDPDLMLKIPCFLSFLGFWSKRPYQEILKDAKENKHNSVVFWVIVIVLFLLALITIRLFIPTRGTGGF